MRKTAPLPAPVVINSIINIVKKPQKSPKFSSEGIKCNTPNTATIIIMKLHSVTLAPPNLSANEPPTGLIKAPTSGPKKTYCVGFISGNKILISMGNAAE